MLFNAKRPPFRPKEEGADHVRLEFPLAGVARKTLHLKVAGISVIAGTIVVGVEAQAGLEVVPDHLEKNTVTPFVAALQEGSPVNLTVYPTGQRYVP